MEGWNTEYILKLWFIYPCYIVKDRMTQIIMEVWQQNFVKSK